MHLHLSAHDLPLEKPKGNQQSPIQRLPDCFTAAYLRVGDTVITYQNFSLYGLSNRQPETAHNNIYIWYDNANSGQVRIFTEDQYNPRRKINPRSYNIIELCARDGKGEFGPFIQFAILETPPSTTIWHLDGGRDKNPIRRRYPCGRGENDPRGQQYIKAEDIEFN
jgi:hypothetical protein